MRASESGAFWWALHTISTAVLQTKSGVQLSFWSSHIGLVTLGHLTFPHICYIAELRLEVVLVVCVAVEDDEVAVVVDDWVAVVLQASDTAWRIRGA